MHHNTMYHSTMSSLTLSDLPPRPTRLSPDALRDVFGGCGGACSKTSDCCGDDVCIAASPQGDMACQ